ncbi:hypothetical protein [Mucilaginibacter sp. SP1R1]|nr:hypothetical protein [Mucilaginibacter sp. SP1R1]MBB6148717.1 hypothetical protein [Mucilaginibacter sp. SP1R1]
MRIEPKITLDKYKDLTPVQRKTRRVAIVVAFCGVFVWAIKILFI